MRAWLVRHTPAGLNRVFWWLLWCAGACWDRVRAWLAGPTAAGLNSILWGLLWCAGAYCLLSSTIAGNPLRDLTLIRHGETTPGLVVEACEDVVDYADRPGWAYKVTYTYRVPDGREFTRTLRGEGRLKSDFPDLPESHRVEVQYLPSDPEVSRIPGVGPACSSVLDWVRYHALSGTFFLLMASPGIILLSDGARRLWRPRSGPYRVPVNLVRRWIRGVSFGEHPGPALGRWLRTAERDEWGWRTYGHANGLHIVTYRAGLGRPWPVKLLAWEVDPDSRAVRFINGDADLAERYGFEPIPPPEAPASPAAARSRLTARHRQREHRDHERHAGPHINGPPRLS